MKKDMKMKNLPVSGKFYNDINDRVNTALSHSPLSASEAMRLVDSYLDGKAAESSDCEAMLAFMMIRVELDRAMVRSSRARQRAAIRKAAMTVNRQTEQSGRNETEDFIPPLTRRERRAAERKQRKLAAKKMNRSRRDVSGDGSGGKAGQSVLATIYSASSFA